MHGMQECVLNLVGLGPPTTRVVQVEAERPVEVMKSVETEQPVVHYEKQRVNTPVTVGKDVRTQVRPRRL